MPEMSHSPEPWQISDDGQYVEFADEPLGFYVDEVGGRNAERIVACVNFCKGIDTELLNRRDQSHGPNVTWLGRNAVRVTVLMGKRRRDREKRRSVSASPSAITFQSDPQEANGIAEAAGEVT